MNNNMHPLDSLSVDEIKKSVNIFKSDNNSDENSVFSYISLEEPDKNFVKNYKVGDTFSRKTKIIGVDSSSKGFEASIDLNKEKVTSLNVIPDAAGPTYTMSEIMIAIQLTLENDEYQAALEKRGITDLSLIQIDPWPGGGITHEKIKEGHRALKTISFLKESPEDNAYARPISGLISHVDLTDKCIVEIEDQGISNLPEQSAKYDAASQEVLRNRPKDISITQPDGPGFDVSNNEISWEGWNLRVSIDPIEGLVIQNLNLNKREIFYRASMSDMVVPYGSADPMHSWKAVHDGTEYGFGSLSNSLTLGCDCLGEIYYFDTNKLNFDGSVETIKNAICLHEEDYGIQWKHSHLIGEGHSEVRRSRRLVISSFSTVGNYDYGIFWYLYLDGTIELEMKLTGIVGISAHNEEIHNPEQDMKITEELVSPIHQHLFNVRIDWFLDGGKNKLIETNAERVPIGNKNPHGTQFQAISSHLKKESEAKRNIAPEKSRVWKITNPNKKNSIGGESAYKFLPGYSPVLLSDFDSPTGKRASFAKYNLLERKFGL